jgi:hypothetical protein
MGFRLQIVRVIPQLNLKEGQVNYVVRDSLNLLQ